MKNSVKMILGLLLLAPGLYASEAAYNEAHKQKIDAIFNKIIEEEIAEALTKVKDPQDAYIELLHKAVDSSLITLAKKVIPHVDINKYREKYKTHPLDRTINPEMVELLLSYPSDINARDNEGETLFMHLCYIAGVGNMHAPKCIELFLTPKNRIDINTVDDLHKTALHHLIVPGNYSEQIFPVVEKLLEHDADPYIEDDRGFTIPKKVHTYFDHYESTKKLAEKTITACAARAPKRIQGLASALDAHLDRDTARMVIGYLPEGLKEEKAKKVSSKKTKSTALTKTS